MQLLCDTETSFLQEIIISLLENVSQYTDEN